MTSCSILLPLVALLLGVLPPVRARNGPYGACVEGVDCTPPRGWRSWNTFGEEIDQQKMVESMEALTDRSRGASFLELGYSDVGLDDNWQACGSGVNGSFHDERGFPIVNATLFEDMGSMTAFGRSLGLTVGWYQNNCICPESGLGPESYVQSVYASEVKMHEAFGFESTKLDGCGQFLDLEAYYDAFEATSTDYLIENCHWGRTIPTETWCPWSYFRTSADVKPNWLNVFANLQSILPFLGPERPLSRPGCWAFPDMLETGLMPSFAEDRSHFGAWAVTSSPLILGHDLRDSAVNDRIWEIVGNKELIAVNQRWAGHPGRLVRSTASSETARGTRYAWGLVVSQCDARWIHDGARLVLAPLKGSSGPELCLDASDPGELIVRDCAYGSASPAQSFEFDSSSGTFRNGGSCLEMWNLRGEDIISDEARVVRMAACSGEANQDFSSFGVVVAGGGGAVLADANDVCADVRTGESPAFSQIGVQVWAKPQPERAVAAFVVNHNGTADPVVLGFADLFDGSYDEGEPVRVRDLYAKQDIGVFVGNFTTSSVELHDSRFYLLSRV